MSEKHQIPGYRPSALGAAMKVRIGEPGIGTSAYSVVTIIVVGAKSGEEASASQLLGSPSSDSVASFSVRNYIPWPLCSISLATKPVHPVWWLDPIPAPLSP